MFKKILSIGALMLASGNVAQAAPVNVVLSGQVAALCTLSGFSADLGWDTLTIQAGVVNQRLGFALVNCNATTGLSITASSVSGGFLVNTLNLTSKTPYQVQMLGGIGGFGPVQLTFPSVLYNSGAIPAGSPLVNANIETRVNVTAFPGASTGTYTDTMTFTLTVN